MVSMPEIKFRIDTCLSGCVKKVGNQWKWITILLRDLVETAVVDAKTEATVLLLGKEDRCPERRTRGVYETSPQVLVDELPESGKFGRRKGIDMTDRRFGAVDSFDLEVELAMRRKIVGFPLGEDVGEVVIFRRDTGKIGFLS